jgi:hypothetical protein
MAVDEVTRLPVRREFGFVVLEPRKAEEKVELLEEAVHRPLSRRSLLPLLKARHRCHTKIEPRKALPPAMEKQLDE